MAESAEGGDGEIMSDQKIDHIASGRDVLTAEIKGLAALSDSLDPTFSRVVERISEARGRVVVTGMGKSGLIARKIAATFASTGKPAVFVHPGEASHGDLGMIARDDIVLALSKSGETPELRDVIAYAGRFSIPLVAITGGADSTLAAAADFVLLLPPAQEACFETHAPTTSTTMMLALGDALAVALLRYRNFTASDFRTFHPGGTLGAALRRVRDLMHGAAALPLCAAAASVGEAIDEINRGGFGCVGVVGEDGALRGIITDGDLRRQLRDGLRAARADEIMTRNPKVVTPETIAGEALAYMSEKKITGLFVVEDGRPVGLLHVHDCLTSGVL